MIKFYANENFPLEMVKALRNFGYNVLTSYESGRANQKISDDQVLAFAKSEQRIVITLNRDDFIALHRQSKEHNGIIICKDDRDYHGQIKFLHDSLLSQAENFYGRLIRVLKQNQPKSAQPIFVIREY
ncbi:MAG: DUF5615 family PIN-like protein [Planktothrix sp.]|uniref:DUF5615 family PIN-like protein n=1 Tax=Planktothrix sp. TaxID=3088171 RepID=UPI0038D3E0DC